jgi:hypothetical protein
LARVGRRVAAAPQPLVEARRAPPLGHLMYISQAIENASIFEVEARLGSVLGGRRGRHSRQCPFCNKGRKTARAACDSGAYSLPAKACRLR